MLNMRLVLTRLLGLLMTVSAMTACAQDGPGYSHIGNSIISNIRVIDGLGNDPVDSQDILIVDGKIAAIGPTGSLES